MLRNSFIENYKSKSTKAKLFEREVALFHTDLNKIIYYQRPISSKSIRRLSKKAFPNFIDDVMCNNDVNTLLYSSNAVKEMIFYLKQKNSILNSTIDFSKSKKKKNLTLLGEIMLKRNNIQIMQSLKDQINKFFQNRNKIIEKYKTKQEKFEKYQPNLENKLKKLYFKPMNEIRLDGFKRVLDKCLKKSKSDDNFQLPDIKFNMDDVYSRLSKNVILSQKALKEKLKKEKEIKEKLMKENDNYNSYYSLYQQQLNGFNNISNKKLEILNNNNKSQKHIFKKKFIIKNKSENSLNKENNENKKINKNKNPNNNFKYFYNSQNMPSFNISKILKFSAGKEFKIKITPRIRKRCLSVLSCGPKPKIKKINFTTEKKEEKKEKIDFKEIRNKSIFDLNSLESRKNVNNLILYNILFLDKNNKGSDIVKVRNYRDENLNSNLHISVINDSIKLVKYFLDKKLDPNSVNDEGKTPLHLAMKKGNKDIIELLIKNGADTQFKDKKGKIPIDYASKEIKHYYIFENS